VSHDESVVRCVRGHELRHVCQSVRPHKTTRLPPDGFFLMKTDTSRFFETPSREFKFHYNLATITGALHEDPCTFMIISSLIFRLRNVSERSCREIPNAHFMSNSFLSENRAFYEVMWNSEADPDMPQKIQ